MIEHYLPVTPQFALTPVIEPKEAALIMQFFSEEFGKRTTLALSNNAVINLVHDWWFMPRRELDQQVTPLKIAQRAAYVSDEYESAGTLPSYFSDCHRFALKHYATTFHGYEVKPTLFGDRYQIPKSAP